MGQSSGGLSEEEIQKMVTDAEANKADDEARKALIEARNEADTLIYSTEKSLKEHGDKLSEEDKTEISNTIEEAKKVLVDDNTDLIKEKVKALEQAALKIGQSIYGQGGAAGGAPEDSGGDGEKKEDVQDAEFKEKKDEEKK